MSKEVAEMLRAARALIATPDRWCQNAYSRTAAGDPILKPTDKPFSRCVGRAIGDVTPHMKDIALYSLAKNAVLRVVHFGTLLAWNDEPERTHAEVLAALDAAAAAEEYADAAKVTPDDVIAHIRHLLDHDGCEP